eukprot:9616398-Alexandrium_andersonii.AAC.1
MLVRNASMVARHAPVMRARIAHQRAAHAPDCGLDNRAGPKLVEDGSTLPRSQRAAEEGWEASLGVSRADSMGPPPESL